MFSTRPRKKHLTRRQRWEKKQAKKYAKWKENHPHPTPYHEWSEYADWMREKILASLASDPSLPSWSSRRGAVGRLLTIDDLAVGFWAIRCTQGKGTNYGQFKCCFNVCVGQKCHDSKIKAILTELQRRKLIAQTGFYCRGKRGNVFVEVYDPGTYFANHRPPIPKRKDPTSPFYVSGGPDTSPPAPRADDMDDPY